MVKDLKSFYKGKKVLITGGLGFIGSNLARELIDLGAKVSILDALIPDMGGNLFNVKAIESKLDINLSDLRSRSSTDFLVKAQEIIFNLAGTLSHIDSMTDPSKDVEINCLGQLTLLESVRHNNPRAKILYAGTRNQYGKAKYLPVDEGHPLEPIDINGINCNAAEAYHFLYHKVYGIKSVSLRLTNVYGPRHQMRHSKQGVLNWFLRQMMDGEEIPLHGSGEQIRDVNYIDDVVNAFLMVGSASGVWGKVYNLGGIPVSLKKFVETSIKIFRKGRFKTVPFPSERKKIEIGDYIADYSRIVRDVGWKPKVSLETGIAKTFKYYEKYKKYYW